MEKKKRKQPCSNQQQTQPSPAAFSCASSPTRATPARLRPAQLDPTRPSPRLHPLAAQLPSPLRPALSRPAASAPAPLARGFSPTRQAHLPALSSPPCRASVRWPGRVSRRARALGHPRHVYRPAIIAASSAAAAPSRSRHGLARIVPDPLRRSQSPQLRDTHAEASPVPSFKHAATSLGFPKPQPVL